MERSNVPPSAVNALVMGGRPSGKVQKYPQITFSIQKSETVSGQAITTVQNTAGSMMSIEVGFGTASNDTYVGIGNGDDTLLIGLEEHLRPLVESSDGSCVAAERIKRFGYKIKLMGTSKISDGSFCQLLFYPSDIGTLPAPKIGRLLTRLGWSVVDDLDVFGVCMGLRDSVQHVPFLREFIDRHLELTSLQTVPKTSQSHYIRAIEPHGQVPAIWDFLGERYGLTPDHLGNFKIQMADASLSSLVSLEWLREIAERDE
jgi:hypothetical protein